MSFFGGVKKIIKPLVDVPKWIGYRQLVTTQRVIFGYLKRLYTPEQAELSESFEAALLRLNLTEADLAKRLQEFTRLQRIWVALLLLVAGYALYNLWFQQAWRAFLPCVGFSLVILTQIFRYHFWLFQIRQRRLGCSFRDWFYANFFSEKKTP